VQVLDLGAEAAARVHPVRALRAMAEQLGPDTPDELAVMGAGYLS
jgi:hypothetical protein